MKEYHKIQTVFLRDPDTKFKTLLEGQFATPEFSFLQENEWIWTEKVDGTNIRVMWNKDNGNIIFGGKTDRAQIPTHLMNRLNELFLTSEQLYTFSDIFDSSVCLYGEGFGAKIQKGGGNYISDGQDFVLFDVKIDDWWLKRDDVLDIAMRLGLLVVPEIKRGTLLELIDYVRVGFNSQWGNFLAEGIVAKPSVDLKTRSGKRIITKIKYKDFQR